MTVLTAPRPRGRCAAGGEQDELRLWPGGPEPPAPAADPPAQQPEIRTDPERAVAAPDRPTLEALVSRVWEGLSAHAPVACPVCAGELRPRYGAGTGVVGGRCGGCGSELS